VSGPILCDYCDALCTRMIQRGAPSARSFTCDVHRERARGAYDPSGYFTDPPLPGRSRFEEEQRDDLEDRWRKAWKAAQKPKRKRAKR
jgi:hypothetical protein